jgi:hypothetical protein
MHCSQDVVVIVVSIYGHVHDLYGNLGGFMQEPLHLLFHHASDLFQTTRPVNVWSNSKDVRAAARMSSEVISVSPDKTNEWMEFNQHATVKVTTATLDGPQS